MSEWVRRLLRLSRELLLLEAGSWGRGQFGNPEEGERPPLEVATKQRPVKTVTDWEDLVCPIVKCSNELYKCQINPITNTNLFIGTLSHDNMFKCNHSYSEQNNKLTIITIIKRFEVIDNLINRIKQCSKIYVDIGFSDFVHRPDFS
jgi:hypothetical protein